MLASLLFATLAAFAAIPAAPLQLQLHGRGLRAGDIASGVPSTTVVARVPQQQAAMDLSETARRRLIANRFPGQHFTLLHRGDLRVMSGKTALAGRGTCLRTVRAIAPGDAMTRADAEDMPCDRLPGGSGLRFDAHRGTVVAAAPIAAGHYLGAIRLPSAAQVPAGTPMHFRTSEGPVSIEREVVTLQPGRPGGRVFARTRDDQVMAARLDHVEEGAKP